MLVGRFIAGLSKPPLILVARVAPALPSQTPFSPGNGPRFTRPSGQCGVGLDGGRALPRPPPLPFPPPPPGGGIGAPFCAYTTAATTMAASPSARLFAFSMFLIPVVV